MADASQLLLASLLPLALLLATLIGLSLGLLGAGGSIITVPIFVYVLGFDPKLAVATSLPVVGITSAFGAIGHWREGNLRPATALLFGLSAVPGAFAGARLATLISGRAQLTILATSMLVAAYFMLRGPPVQERALEAPHRGRYDIGLYALIVVAALAVGLLTGLAGIGGGFLIVPALVLLARVPMKAAVGTSLLVIAMNAASGTAGYRGQVEVSWSFVIIFAAVAVTGILPGTYLVRFVSQVRLRRGFAVFLVVIGALILLENRSVLLGSSPSIPSQRTESGR